MKLDGTKTAFYAAVGAPVVATRKLTDTLTELGTKFAGDFRKEYGTWATEGEKVVGRIADQKLVEDFTSRVDVDNISEQVGKLRGQLEDLVATWRQNFNPEKPVEAAQAVKVEIDEAADKQPATCARAPTRPRARSRRRPAKRSSRWRRQPRQPPAPPPASLPPASPHRPRPRPRARRPQPDHSSPDRARARHRRILLPEVQRVRAGRSRQDEGPARSLVFNL